MYIIYNNNNNKKDNHEGRLVVQGPGSTWGGWLPSIADL